MADPEDIDYIYSSGSDHERPSVSAASHQTRSGKQAVSNGARPAATAQPKARWEDIQRSWDTVLESADGSLTTTIANLAEGEKRRRLYERDATPLQRGIIRHLVIILDLSSAMSEKDLRPNRHLLALRELRTFVPEFFDQNPISQLGLIVTSDGLAKTICALTGNPADILDGLVKLAPPGMDPAGSPSLQNSLEVARGMLFHAPSHGTREVLLLWGALLSSDPGDVHRTIESLVGDRIRASVIGLAAQVKVLSELVARTNTSAKAGGGGGGGRNAAITSGERGTGYAVALNEQHLRTLLMGYTLPPLTLTTEASTSSLLQMGFPSSKASGSGTGLASAPTLCACHSRPTPGGYLCPRCGAKADALPTECAACGLTLILSTHLARSYHHLFPLKGWVDVPWKQVRALRLREGVRAECFGCLVPFPPIPAQNGSVGGAEDQRRQLRQGQGEQMGSSGGSESHRYRCTVCDQHFCIECDLWAHEVGFNCPGCMSLPTELELDGQEGVAGGAK